MPKTRAAPKRLVKQFEPVPIKPHVTAKVQVVHPESITAYYSNYVEVAHTEYEFSLSFAKLPAKLRPQQLLDVQAGQPLLLEPNLLVEVPLRLLKGLIRALETQVTIYEKRYGQIPESRRKGGQPPHGKTTKTK